MVFALKLGKSQYIKNAAYWTPTLTMDSFVWAISDITPSVMMSKTKYCDPSFTDAAYLQNKAHQCIY